MLLSREKVPSFGRQQSNKPRPKSWSLITFDKPKSWGLITIGLAPPLSKIVEPHHDRQIEIEIVEAHHAPHLFGKSKSWKLITLRTSNRNRNRGASSRSENRNRNRNRGSSSRSAPLRQIEIEIVEAHHAPHICRKSWKIITIGFAPLLAHHDRLSDPTRHLCFDIKALHPTGG